MIRIAAQTICRRRGDRPIAMAGTTVDPLHKNYAP